MIEEIEVENPTGTEPSYAKAFLGLISEMLSSSRTIPKQQLEEARRDRLRLKAEGLPTDAIDRRIHVLEGQFIDC